MTDYAHQQNDESNDAEDFHICDGKSFWKRDEVKQVRAFRQYAKNGKTADLAGNYPGDGHLSHIPRRVR